MNKLSTKVSLIKMAIVVALGYSNITFATALVLPTEPLITATSVQPNMMLLIDSSGSMGNIVEPDAYDATVDYYNCPNNREFSGGTVTIRIKANGEVKFNGKRFGTTGNRRCFNDDTLYDAQLNANANDGSYKVPANDYSSNGGTYYGTASYKGNFLNWYFSDANFGVGARKKPGTKIRMEVAQEAATALIDSLQNIRVGIARFNGGTGARIIGNVTDLTLSNKTAFKTAIDLITFGGGTPLGEALSQIGRYYTRGYSAESNLLIHPNTAPTSIKTNNVFIQSPAYASGLSAPDAVIQNWCQPNFVVAMTDGQPSSDSNVSTYLRDYDNGTGSILDDVALAMYEIDLRPDLDDSGEEVINNASTYIIGFADESVTSSTLLQNTASNGGGEFIGASNASELAQAFKKTLDNIFAKVASRSGVSFNAPSLSTDNAVYSANFNSAQWSGSLQAFELSGSGEIATTATWDVTTKLDAILDANLSTTRNIFTYNPVTKKGVPFTSGSLSPAQLADLSKGPEGSTGIDNLINYISGKRADEGEGVAEYRVRSSRLGDIVNSTSVYVGAPQLNWPNWTSANKIGASSANYSAFKTAQASRTPMLYVGANDGMLHGFNASLTGVDAGKEKFAYIPNIVYSTEPKAGLNYLANKNYAHQFYVDLTPTVSDVYINSAWRTVLIGGLRSGGKGLFALDITDPTKFSSSTANAQKLALWEFSSTDDSDFGYSYSKPTVVMMANGKWAVIVGNGYNNAGTDGNAKLFILFLEPQDSNDVWNKEVDYFVIDTGAGTAGTPNGLSTPSVVDTNGDGVADRVYAGDLEGNMWAFDISASNASNWKVDYGTVSAPKPLFTAKDSTGKAQPITSAPIISKNVSPTGSAPDLLVFFGTGKYIEETDKSNVDVMSYYAVIDKGNQEQLRGNLTPRTLNTFDSNKRLITGASFSWATSSGWYFDLNNNSTAQGERVISDSLIRNNVLFFTTVIPDLDSGDVCTANSDSWIMGVDLATGKAPTFGVFDVNFDGVIDDSSVAATALNDKNNNGIVDDLESSGVKTANSMVAEVNILGNNAYLNDADGQTEIKMINTGPSAQEGRLSWEEQIR
ncbi:pilus assembly protein [Psychromonas hadalis]|uniref:pilus assembly protein n=1 Tax=Psychromonas hadalis TaxID=211669 RepID=UPI0003B59673|nr:PilC/PilY family type IV pilus protein [Psychromonas hadalis]